VHPQRKSWLRLCPLGAQLLWPPLYPQCKILAMPLTPGDLACGFSDLEMTWLLYCAGAATVFSGPNQLAWSEAWHPIGAILHSSDEPVEHLQ